MDSLRVRQLAAEALGTFLLAASVGLSIVQGGPLPTPAVAGLTLLVLVYVLGPVSGCQLNPAVTLGLWSIRRAGALQAAQYIVAQAVGAVAAIALLSALTGAMPRLDAGVQAGVWIAEAAGAFVLTLGVCAVALGKVADAAAGLTIGGALLVGVLGASVASNGVLNPAVAVGIGSVSPAYLLAPLIGGVAAAQLHRWLVTAS